MRPAVDDLAIRRYLLGELPEPQAAALEECYFAESDALEQVAAVENDLVDDYAAGRLAPAQRERFERHYLASPAHLRRAVAARALALAGATGPGRRAEPPATAPAAGSRRLGWAPAALAAALLLALGTLWLLGPRPPGGESAAWSPAGPASPAAQDPRSPGPGAPSPAARASTAVAFALSPILSRGAEQTVLSIPPDVDDVVLHLEGEPLGETALAFDIRTVEGKRVARGSAQAAPPSGPPRAIAIVRVAAALLPPEDYLLGLAPAGARGETLLQYSFRVARRSTPGPPPR
jgi:hypothetical protein